MISWERARASRNGSSRRAAAFVSGGKNCARTLIRAIRRRLRRRGEAPLELARDDVDVEALLDAPPPGGAELGPEPGVGEHALERVGERRGVAFRDEQPGAVAEQGRDPARLGADRRHADAHRLEQADRDPLVLAGRRHDAREDGRAPGSRGEPVEQLAVRQRRRQHDVVSRARARAT